MRAFFTTISIALALVPSARAAESEVFPAPVYVTLQAANAVEVLPAGATWEGLDGAHYNAISPDGTRLLVSSKNTNNVYVVDTGTGKTLATFDIGATPQGVAIGPRGQWGLAVSAGTDALAVIDLENLKIAKTIKVGKIPHNARFSGDGRLAYITLQGGQSVAVVNMQTLAKVKEIPVPGLHGPHNLDISADGSVLWIRGVAGKVAAVNIETGEQLALIEVGSGHAGIDVIPGGRYVFTGAIADDIVSVIDSKSFELIKHIDVGPGSHGVRASRDGRWVYVGMTSTDEVTVIDTQSLEVVRQIPTQGQLPFWISVVGNN
ncbi:MAG: YncE family protein [Gammaproteobacteria bacterium]|nr:YncE family protein [Gammaproteobacteria bacterium]